MTVVFWNLHNSGDTKAVRMLIESCCPHVLIFVEASNLDLESVAPKTYTLIQSVIQPTADIRALSLRSAVQMSIVQEHKGHLSLYRLLTQDDVFLIAGIHFPSKLFQDEKSQLCEAIDYMQQIGRAEKDFDISKTIIIGDFNMNPFEPGMIAGNAFNSVCSMEVAMKRQRQVQTVSYGYFYNPSWRLYGNHLTEKYGTYFHHSPGHCDFHWNIFDQALLRPSILTDYRVDFRAMEDDYYFSHRKKAQSDHAPIVLDIERR
jgi:exonuclease III